jgi:ubiquinone/menaquinone biosynthesis C-methylase UbiE
VVTNAVSVDYLNNPLEVFKEMNRVLKPGGRAIMSFSNRCFPTKGARHFPHPSTTSSTFRGSSSAHGLAATPIPHALPPRADSSLTYAYYY